MTIGVFAALSVATACLLPDGPAREVAVLPPGRTKRMLVEHPTGASPVSIEVDEREIAELVARLRARNVALPAILITGRLSGDLGRLAADAGFRRVVEKPFEDGSLLEGIHEALALHPDDRIGLRKSP